MGECWGFFTKEHRASTVNPSVSRAHVESQPFYAFDSTVEGCISEYTRK